MKYRLFTASLFLFALSFSCFAAAAHAQLLQSVPETAVNVDMSPENPGPNQSVYVSITSYGTNLDAAMITWKVNGQTKSSGRGEKSLSFTTGALNTTTTLTITISTTEGEVINKNIKIQPVAVDLLWQSSSFVPAFYKGKALFTYQNDVTFIALPHLMSGGVEIPAKNLIYKWTKNGSVVDYASGYGKNTYTVVGALISRALTIEVEVTSPNLSAIGTANTVVEPKDPAVLIYEKSPIYGIEFQKALTDTVDLTDSKEISVVGMPYFYGVSDAFSPDLIYKWAINSRAIDQDVSEMVRVFRQKEGTNGTSRISLSIENQNKILQLASESFNLKFSSPTQTPAAF